MSLLTKTTIHRILRVVYTSETFANNFVLVLNQHKNFPTKKTHRDWEGKSAYDERKTIKHMSKKSHQLLMAIS